MPIIQSAKKRVRVAARQSTQNAKTKRSLRNSIKAFYAAVSDKKDSTQAQSDAYSAIDTAVKKGVITKNKAARKKQQLNQASKTAGTTKVGTKKAKSTTTKKTTAKKPAVKKAASKTTAKKSTTKTATKKTTK
jgi:ribosomal protein S20